MLIFIQYKTNYEYIQVERLCPVPTVYNITVQ